MLKEAQARESLIEIQHTERELAAAKVMRSPEASISAARDLPWEVMLVVVVVVVERAVVRCVRADSAW